MRDRLIELIDGFGDDLSFCDICHRPSEECEGCKNEQLADYLLANGVIVLPCKVGDVVFCFDDIREGEALEISALIVKQVYVDSRGCKIYSEGPFWAVVLSPDDFGKTVFLTREEAEKALSERSGE